MSKKVIRDEKMIKSIIVEKVFEEYNESDLLKARAASNFMSRVSNGNTIPISNEYQEASKQILKKANSAAEEIIEKALQESFAIQEKAKKEGHDEGFKAGFSEGLSQFKQATKKSLSNIGKIVNETVNQKNKIIAEAEEDILKLTFAIVSKIIKAELSVSKEIVLNSARKALQKVISDSKIKLKVSPHDYETLREHIDDIASKTGVTSVIDIVPDSNITAGGCLLETDSGRIDAQIEVQLDEIEKSLNPKNEGSDEAIDTKD